MNEYVAVAFLGAILRELNHFRNHQKEYNSGKSWLFDRWDDLVFGLGGAWAFAFYGSDLFGLISDLAIWLEYEWLFIIGSSWHPLWAFLLGLLSSVVVTFLIDDLWPWIQKKLGLDKSEPKG